MAVSAIVKVVTKYKSATSPDDASREASLESLKVEFMPTDILSGKLLMLCFFFKKFTIQCLSLVLYTNARKRECAL